VLRLHRDARLDTRVIHGDGTTSAAEKGGDNLGFSGHKRVKGCKVVAFCDRHCNVIAPFLSAPGNRNESPLLHEALPRLTRIAHAVGLDLRGSVVSLDGVYDCPRNRKEIFNRGMVPNINRNPRGRKRSSILRDSLRIKNHDIALYVRRAGASFIYRQLRSSGRKFGKNAQPVVKVTQAQWIGHIPAHATPAVGQTPPRMVTSNSPT
jgi:hypothetical protein